MLLRMKRRLAQESGAFHTIGVPNLLIQPVIILDTSMLLRLQQISVKKGSSCQHMPDKYELTESGLM